MINMNDLCPRSEPPVKSGEWIQGRSDRQDTISFRDELNRRRVREHVAYDTDLTRVTSEEVLSKQGRPQKRADPSGEPFDLALSPCTNSRSPVRTACE